MRTTWATREMLTQKPNNKIKQKRGCHTRGKKSPKMARCTLIEPNAMPKSFQTFQLIIGVIKLIQVTEMSKESKSKSESRYKEIIQNPAERR